MITSANLCIYPKDLENTKEIKDIVRYLSS